MSRQAYKIAALSSGGVVHVDDVRLVSGAWRSGRRGPPGSDHPAARPRADPPSHCSISSLCRSNGMTSCPRSQGLAFWSTTLSRRSAPGGNGCARARSSFRLLFTPDVTRAGRQKSARQVRGRVAETGLGERGHQAVVARNRARGASPRGWKYAVTSTNSRAEPDDDPETRPGRGRRPAVTVDRQAIGRLVRQAEPKITWNRLRGMLTTATRWPSGR
jgi:hypothetical protein